MMDPHPAPCQISMKVLMSQKTGLWELASQFCRSNPNQLNMVVSAPVLDKNSLARVVTTTAETK